MNRSRLLESIKAHEGYRATPYKDSLGYWTVGYGHLLEDDFIEGSVGAILTLITDPQKHESWLDDDLDDALELAQRWLGFAWNTLNSVRKEVVTEMAFQLGTKLTKFAKFRAAMMDQDWSTAAAEMLDSKWHEQTPNRAEELARRFEDGAV